MFWRGVLTGIAIGFFLAAWIFGIPIIIKKELRGGKHGNAN